MADDYDEEYNDSTRNQNDFEEEDYLGTTLNNHRREQSSGLGRRSNNQEEDEEEQKSLRHRKHSNQDEEDEEDGDDDQQRQKLNGKIDALQQKIGLLESELVRQRQTTEDLKLKYEIELQSAWKQADYNAASEVQRLQSESKKWKSKCENIQERLDVALAVNPPTPSLSAVPIQLQEELFKYCQQYNLFTDLQQKSELSILDASKIFESMHRQLKRKSSAISSSDNGRTGSVPRSDDESGSIASTTINRTEQQLSQYHQHHKLNDKIRNLEEELKLAANHADDIHHLKNRVLQLTERIHQEKDGRKSSEQECATMKRKLEMLSDHIEKLVMHIKREGAQKVKFAEHNRVLEKDSLRLKEKYDLLYRKVAAKDRLVYELREGSKVLEDQLKLMDEKYLELRNKLDYARYVAAKKIKKAEKQAADLRTKWAMTGSMTSLDALPMPSMGGGMDASSVSSALESVGSHSFHLQREKSGFGNIDGNDPATPVLKKEKRGSSKLQVNVDNSGFVGDGVPSLTSIISQNTVKTNNTVLTLDSVLEKIQKQHGNRGEWTEERARKLLSGK